MKMITDGQRRRIFGLLRATNLEHQRENIIGGFVPSASMKDLSYADAFSVIAYLEGLGKPARRSAAPAPDARDKQRKKLIALCYGFPAEFNFWSLDAQNKKRFNREGLDSWLLNGAKSPFKKQFNALTKKELSKLIGIFDKIKKNYEDD